MKKIFTLVASLFLTVAMFAADLRPKSALTIRSLNKSDIRVVLDGKRFEPNDDAIMIQNVDDGTHAVRIYREDASGRYNLLGRRYQLVYDANVSLKRRTQLIITVERNGWITMQENKIKRSDPYMNAGADRRFDYDRDGKLGDYDSNTGYDNTYARGMERGDFQRVMQSIDKEWLESNKLKSAVQIVHSNQLSASQVKEMMMLFTFENNKLELAKQAYQTTADKNNYSAVFDCFSFSASRADLQRYIASCR